MYAYVNFQSKFKIKSTFEKAKEKISEDMYARTRTFGHRRNYSLKY